MKNGVHGDPSSGLRALATAADADAAFAPDTLLDDAARATQCAPVLSRHERAAFEAACRGFAGEAPRLTPLGRTRAAHVLRESLAKLLRVRSYVDRFPAIADAKLERPIFIVAPFRTGTTFLHRLLAQDPQLRWLHTWEGTLAPPAEPELRLDPTYFDLDGRIATVERSLERLHRMNPRLRDVHATGARLPEECFGLLETAFTAHSFVFYGCVPDYFEWLDRCSEAHWLESYRLYALQLALLQWWSPSARWVLKSPVHLWNLDALLGVFPDALIVLLHRDPLCCVPSFCRLLATHHAFAYRRIDEHAIGALAHDYTRKVLARAAGARSRFPAERFLDLDYEGLLSDPLECVRCVYGRAGTELTVVAEERMRDWLAQQPLPATGREYSAAQYGLDARALARDFQDWSTVRA
jgi:hypothetical protein